MANIREQIKLERRWNQKCLLISQFHYDRIEENGDNTRGHKWRVEDSARELNLSVGFVSESIRLARALGKYDTLKFYSRENALKFLRESAL